MKTFANLSSAIVLGLVLSSAASADLYDAEIFWTGFGYSWQDNPHRLSELKTRYVATDLDRYTGYLTARHLFLADVGTVSDTADYFSCYQAARSTEVSFGRARIGPMGLRCGIDEVADNRSTYRRALDEIEVLSSHVESMGDVTCRAFLGGFYLDASRDQGWHFRRFGLGIDAVSFDEANDRVQFDVWATVAPSNSPDPLTRYDGDCLYELYVDVIFVIGPSARVDVTYEERTQTSSETTSASLAATVSESLDSRANPEEWRGFLAMTGFSIDLASDTEHAGRYLREMSAWTHDLDYDPSSGRASYEVVHEFSNEGTWDYSWTMTSYTRTAIVEIRDANAEVEPGRVSGSAGCAVGEETEVLFGE
ncbi:MAG: hypothetical protein HY720_00010 [Planctomycetes bacterium]|nr:hypothetical protein [Planctomycetota bacterium]